jgi:hypothetical protein
MTYKSQNFWNGEISQVSISGQCQAPMAFKISYVYDYITKLCEKYTEIIQNHLKPNVLAIGQGEAMRGKCPDVT